MTFIKNDIIIRSRKGNDTVWVSERLLISVCDGLTEHYLRTKPRYRFLKTVPPSRQKQDILPDTGNPWRYAKIEGKWYYDLERIPDVPPANYRSKLGSAADLIERYENALTDVRKNDLHEIIKTAVDTAYTGYYPAYTRYDSARTDLLARSAAALNAICDYVMMNDVDLRKNDLFVQLSQVVSDLKLAYLPVNFRCIKAKVMEVLDGAIVTEVVTLPREGNRNASRFDDPQLISWLMMMRQSGMNTSNAFIARRIQKLCAIHEKRSPSFSWLEHYLAKQEVKNLTTKRHKNGRLAMSYNGYIPIAGAVYAGDCWMMDGTRVNFIEFTHNGKDWSHLVVVMVYDAHSGAMLARSYGLAEDRWLYQEALAKAAKKTGYLPYEVICDRFPGHNTQEWESLVHKIKLCGTKVEVVHTMQGKAKMERAIDVVQMVGMQHSDKYYGQGIQSKREYAHRTDEVLNEMRKRAKAEGWNMDRAIDEAERAFERYNNTALNEQSAKRTITETPMQLHDTSATPYVYKADPMEMLFMFGHSTRIQVRNMGMIVATIKKQKYTYVVSADNWNLIRKHKEVVMYYDIDDLSRVNLYTATDNPKDEQFICEATEQNAVQWHGPSKDVKAMGKARQRIADIKKQNEEEMASYAQLAGMEDRILLGIGSAKQDREAAETAWLMERANTKPAPAKRQLEEDDDEVMVVHNARDLY